MDIKDIKDLAKTVLGQNCYYEQVHSLDSDIRFFNMYMERNKKSIFNLEVRIIASNRLFDKLYERYCRNISDIENVFAEYVVLRELINDIHTEKHRFSNDIKRKIIYYFEKYDDFDVNSVVGDVINCSHSCSIVRDAICKLKTEI